MSADVFLYFRGSVVAGGRAAFERVLQEGVLREKDWDDGGAGELMLDIAREAFERKTGREWEHETHVSVETGSNRRAWGSRESGTSGRWSGWVAVRSRASTSDGETDTVRHWMIEDPVAAHAAHLQLERQRAGRSEVRVIDDLKLSSRVPNGIRAAPVCWVRSLVAE